LGLIKNLINCN